jgi:hypothetical protein
MAFAAPQPERITLKRIREKQERYFELLDAAENDCDYDEMSDLEYWFSQDVIPWLLRKLER